MSGKNGKTPTTNEEMLDRYESAMSSIGDAIAELEGMTEAEGLADDLRNVQFELNELAEDVRRELDREWQEFRAEELRDYWRAVI